jgi:chemotaxis signal transduction protein
MTGAEVPVDGKVLTFHTGSGRFAIPLEWVRAVLEGATEADSEGESGEIRFRGRELPVMDIGEWFGRSGAEGKFPSLLIIGEGEALAAVRVDSPGRVLNAGTLSELPTLCRELVQGLFCGVIIQGESLILVVDPEGLYKAIIRNGD